MGWGLSTFKFTSNTSSGMAKRGRLLTYLCMHTSILIDLILYVPSTIIQLNRNGSSWVQPVLS